MNLSTPNPTAPSQSTQSSQPNPQPNNNATNRTQEKTNLVFQLHGWNDPRKMNTPDDSLNVSPKSPRYREKEEEKSPATSTKMEAPVSEQPFHPSEIQAGWNALQKKLVTQPDDSETSEVSLPDEIPQTIRSKFNSHRIGSNLCARPIILSESPTNPESRFLFWCMVGNRSVKTIIDLTTGADNTTPYYPNNIEEQTEFNLLSFHPYCVKSKEFHLLRSNDSCCMNSYELSGPHSLKVRRFNFISWLNFQGCPANDLRTLVDIIQSETDPSSPVVIHCKEKHGRSATLALAYVLTHEIEKGLIKRDSLEKRLIEIILSFPRKLHKEIKFDYFSSLYSYATLVLQEQGTHQPNLETDLIEPVNQKQSPIKDSKRKQPDEEKSGGSIKLNKSQGPKMDSALLQAWDSLVRQTDTLRIGYLTTKEVDNLFVDVYCHSDKALPIPNTNKYLHANWVNENIIIAQAPITNPDQCLKDFWSVVYSLEDNGNPATIVDLTNANDGLSPYYPSPKESIQYPELALTSKLREKTNLPNCYFDSYQIVWKQGAPKTVNRIHFPNWPDRGCCTLEELTQLVALIETKAPRSKILAHCKAGRGRSPTVVLALLFRRMKEGLTKKTLPDELVRKTLMIREARSLKAVEKEQFNLLYQYAKSLCSSIDSSA